MKKALLILVVLVLLVVVSVPIWVDAAAKNAVESSGTTALGVPVTVTGIDLGIFGGTCRIDGMEIGNPEGYGEKNFFALGHGEVAVDLGSVLGEKVVVPKLVLEDIEMNFQRTAGGTNYGKILDHLGKDAPEEEAPENAKRYVIEEVVIRNIKVKSKVLVAPTVTLTIPEIRFENLGSDTPNGVVLRTVFRHVFRAILAEIARTGGDIVPDLAGVLKDGLKGVLGVGGKLLEGTGGVGKKAVEGIGKGLGGLLGGGDDDGEKKD